MPISRSTHNSHDQGVSSLTASTSIAYSTMKPPFSETNHFIPEMKRRKDSDAKEVLRAFSDDEGPSSANENVDVTMGESPSLYSQESEPGERREARLYIGNLAHAATEKELGMFFSGYTAANFGLPKNPRTKKSVGYAFADLANTTEAQTAISELSGKEILGRKVSVQFAQKIGPADVITGNPRPPSETKTVIEAPVTTREIKIPISRRQKQRGPPTDGVPSKTKVMVANLPYDLGEDKVR